MAPGLFGLGVTVAMERDRGILEFKRALPMPAGVYIAAKLCVALIFSAIVSLLLIALAVVSGNGSIAPRVLVSLCAVSILGVESPSLREACAA